MQQMRLQANWLKRAMTAICGTKTWSFERVSAITHGGKVHSYSAFVCSSVLVNSGGLSTGYIV